MLPAFKGSQLKSGLWRGKDSHKITYDILAAVDYAGLSEDAQFYSPLAALQDCHDEYALLVKLLPGNGLSQDDERALSGLKQTIASLQDADGSFGHTVTGTVIQLERLLALGVSKGDPVIRNGVSYLLSQRKPLLQGIHMGGVYSLSVPNVYTSEDRSAEFLAAKTYRTECVPSHMCYRTMAVIPNAVCLNLLVRLGLDSDPGVSAALQSLYTLCTSHGGLCATEIKKPYI